MTSNMTMIRTSDSPLIRTSTLEVRLATTFAEIDQAKSSISNYKKG
jgi:hypothetical protein